MGSWISLGHEWYAWHWIAHLSGISKKSPTKAGLRELLEGQDGGLKAVRQKSWAICGQDVEMVPQEGR
jgi:hypothetical protein